MNDLQRALCAVVLLLCSSWSDHLFGVLLASELALQQTFCASGIISYPARAGFSDGLRLQGRARGSGATPT